MGPPVHPVLDKFFRSFRVNLLERCHISGSKGVSTTGNFNEFYKFSTLFPSLPSSLIWGEAVLS